MNYEHKGVKIELLEGSGEFSATIDGKIIVKPSLAAIKRVIDGGVKDKAAYKPPLVLLTFHPVRKAHGQNASELPRENFEVVVDRIAIDRRSRWVSNHHFELVGGNRQAALILNTPEGFKALTAIWAHDEETYRIRQERDTARDLLHKAIPWITASEEAKKKGLK